MYITRLCRNTSKQCGRMFSTESLSQLRSRLIYQSRKRGTLENGLILSTFVNRFLNSFTNKQLSLYDQLINSEADDWSIYYWATGKDNPPRKFDNEIMCLLKEHTNNRLREVRNSQPELNKELFQIV
ncbi:Succinate dehydrogenase assembly factor 2, mitochondrial [Oopsacas minuta]|uniref:Succinate dehydrogenase assembly factor 2, mitochondrial n=1 Tax=Oopsacas minuta TaxID=111878 RepID=A0AAV7JDK3_9METZ|nr:Succinate dehydrogenase assembly factor 2, mitochondrial [Oopsacas minuta]